MGRRNEVRIVGGRWRGHRLHFPSLPGLRPTPDLVRETLFNWLAGKVEGRRVLDLYAGSGAVGLEAASRGAEVVWLVERNPQAFRALGENLLKLGCGDRVKPIRADAVRFLRRGAEEPFDIVFVDPPFGKGLIAPTCRLLEERGWLKLGSLIYLEAESHLPLPPLPGSWQPLKEKKVGQLIGRLYRRESPS